MENGEVSSGSEQRSSVTLKLNAKGEVQPEVKVYAGDTEAQMHETALVAMKSYETIVNALRNAGVKVAGG